MNRRFPLHRIRQGLAAGTLVVALAAAGLLTAQGGPAAAAEPIEVELELESTPLEASLEMAELRASYDAVYRKAKRLDVAPERRASEREIGPRRLAAAEQRLRERVREARKERREARQARREVVQEQQPESVEAPAEAGAESGASNGTLESIAACESGGNPGAVDPSGTYRGKYQFDRQTWSSVGGSGDPASASEAEQDRRAAALYAQRGSSPWPTCGS